MAYFSIVHINKWKYITTRLSGCNLVNCFTLSTVCATTRDQPTPEWKDPNTCHLTFIKLVVLLGIFYVAVNFPCELSFREENISMAVGAIYIKISARPQYVSRSYLLVRLVSTSTSFMENSVALCGKSHLSCKKISLYMGKILTEFENKKNITKLI